MRIREIVKLTAGSCIVYLVIAACSSYSDADRKVGPDPVAATDGSPSPSTTSDTGPSITNPVPTALADGTKSGTRLKLRFYEGTDGSRKFLTFLDSQFQTTCDVQRTHDDKYRCLPSGTGYLLYSDTACKVPTLVQGFKAEPAPKIAVQRSDGSGAGSAGIPSYYAVGALATPPASKVYQSSGDSCTELTLADYYAYYTLGNPIAETDFVEMTIKDE